VGDEGTAPKSDQLLPAARNFTLGVAERVRGLEGVPAHIRRKREIEDRFAALVKLLRHRLAAGDTLHELRFVAARLDLQRLNDLIERHNRYYPIEANLPIDSKSGKSLDGEAPFVPLSPITPEALLASI